MTRVKEIEDGRVTLLDGHEVLHEIRERLSPMKLKFHPEARIELNKAVDYYRSRRMRFGSSPSRTTSRSQATGRVDWTNRRGAPSDFQH
jgi:hypothetical protein